MSFLLEGKSWPPPADAVFTNGQKAELWQAVWDKSANPATEESYVPEHLKHSTEVDPNGFKPEAPGAKLDAGKVDTLRGAVLYFPKALEAVAHVSELGARKYSWMGWRTVPDGINRYGAALLRHLMHEPFATDDGPTGLGSDVLHAAQTAWNALARLELILKERNEQSTRNT